MRAEIPIGDLGILIFTEREREGEGATQSELRPRE